MMLNISNDAQKFLENMQVPKQYKQITKKIFSLLRNPIPADSKHISGYAGYFRIDSGEYRIVYRNDDSIILITCIGKRNDNEIYKQMYRKIG